MGILLILLFLFFAYLLAFRKLSSIIVLPLMAMSFHFLTHLAFFFTVSEKLASSLPAEKIRELAPYLPSTYHDFGQSLLRALFFLCRDVLADGPGRLFAAIVAVILGGVLAKMLENAGIGHQLVRFAAEVAGENPLVHAILLTAVSALLFTVLAGLGAVILVATIVFPVWLSVGLSPIVAACAFLLALSLGGALNPVNWKFYIEALTIPQATVQSFAMIYIIPFTLISLLFILREHKKEGVYRYFSSLPSPQKKPLPFLAYLAPFLPILILMASGLLQIMGKIEKPFPINAALMLGIMATALAVKPEKGRVQFLLQSCFESFKDIAPAVFLIMGIGMLIQAVFAYPVTFYLQPLIAELVPNSALMYVLTFSFLAPLALYRGPLNIWGLGLGLGLLLHQAGLSQEAVMGLLYSVGMIQGVCDPTNTHNVWVANQLGVDVNDIMKKTLPYMWALAIIGLVMAAFRFF